MIKTKIYFSFIILKKDGLIGLLHNLKSIKIYNYFKKMTLLIQIHISYLIINNKDLLSLT